MPQPTSSTSNIQRLAPAGEQNTIAPLLALLGQLRDVIGALSQQQYTASHEKTFKSTIGGHVRHSLDHVAALLGGVETGAIDYDRRQRGTDVETRRDAAVAAIADFDKRLSALDDDALARPVSVALALSADGKPHQVTSSIGREMAFVMSHTIHHNAIIAAMARSLGVEPPGEFGFAPSTLAYLRQRESCAR